MFSTLHLKTLHPLQSSSSSSALSSTKLKISLIRTLIVSHMCRLMRALSKFKSTIVNTLIRDNHNYSSSYYSSKSNTTNKCPKKHCSNNTTTTQKIILGSFRLHYNWCSSNSSHILPVPTRAFQGLKPPSSTSNSRSNSSHFHNYEQQQQGEDYWAESELAGYLQWLEENEDDDDDDNGKVEMNEIDMLAEMFIANCHEKFRLEKQESDRRFQEILARGL